MKKTRLLLLIFLPAVALLSLYLIFQPPLALDANFQCEEYCWDGEDEEGEWVSGCGTMFTFDGRLEHDPSLRLKWERVIAHIEVYGEEGILFEEEVLFKLRSGGKSRFYKVRDLDEIETLGCSDYKYGVLFKSPEGKVIAHRGDFESSINHPLYSDDVSTPNLTDEAFADRVLTAVWQTMEATYTAPSPPP